MTSFEDFWISSISIIHIGGGEKKWTCVTSSKKREKGHVKSDTLKSEIQKWLDLIIELATSKTGQHSLWL